jgi:glycosyl-4,4'-diaponeurosporenoate acyltransferase
MTDLPLGRLIVVDVLAWASLSGVVGFTASKLPDRVFERETGLTRIRAFEDDGRFWHRAVGIRRWKDHLPEAGGFFGGVSKRRLGGLAGIDQQLIETRRAEWAHAVLLACGPVFLLWNPPGLGAAMIGYAIGANVPCMLVVRFNRARLLRVQARRGRGRAGQGGR